MAPTKHLTVVGGGITGLAAAYHAHKLAAERGAPLAISLVEAEARPGGKLMTHHQDGFIIEGGPDSFLTSKPWALELARELGIPLISTNDDRREIYILRRGRLHKLPGGMRLTIPTEPLPFLRSGLISWPGKLRAMCEPVIPARRDPSDESLGAFIRRRFGQEILDVIAEPMMAGIFVAEADNLSLHASFPDFAAMERDHGSLMRAMWHRQRTAPPAPASKRGSLFITPAEGIQALPEALVRALSSSVEFITGRRAQRVSHDGRDWWLDLADGTRMQTDALIITTPAHAAAAMLRDFEGLPQLLSTITYTTTATLSLAFRADEIDHPLDGFGFVVPKGERASVLASTWMTTKFDGRAPAGHVLIRLFFSGELAQADDQAMIAAAQRDLAAVMGIRAQPVLHKVFRWQQASPNYSVGHLERITELERLCPPGLKLAGSAYRGVGIPDCVHQAQQSAAAILDQLNQPAG